MAKPPPLTAVGEEEAEEESEKEIRMIDIKMRVSMNIEDFRAYCLSLEGVNVNVFDFCNIKCPSEQIEELQDRYEGIKPGYHMNKRHWMSVYFDKDVPEKTIKELVRQSYDRVVASLSKKEREAVQDTQSFLRFVSCL